MAGKLVLDLFLFFQKALCEVKQVSNSFLSIFVGSPQLEHTIKTNCMKVLKTFDPKIA